MSTSSRSSGPVGSIERLADPDVMDHNLHILKWLEGIKRKTMARKTLIIRKNPPSITVKTHLASPTGTVPEEGSALMTPPPTSTSHPSHELRKDVTTLRTASSAAASPSAATADDAGAPVNRSERKRKQSMSHDKNDDENCEPLRRRRCINFRERTIQRVQGVNTGPPTNTALQSGERPLRRILRVNFGKNTITLIRRRA